MGNVLRKKTLMWLQILFNDEFNDGILKSSLPFWNRPQICSLLHYSSSQLRFMKLIQKWAILQRHLSMATLLHCTSALLVHQHQWRCLPGVSVGQTGPGIDQCLSGAPSGRVPPSADHSHCRRCPSSKNRTSHLSARHLFHLRTQDILLSFHRMYKQDLFPNKFITYQVYLDALLYF